LKSLNILIAVATNQSGVARGAITLEDIYSFHTHMNSSSQANGSIDHFEICPHHPEGTVEEYRIICDCRKPLPGLVKRILNNFQLNGGDALMFGNAASDIKAGEASGVESILVSPGNIQSAVMNRIDNL
jgi:D-glycero-D-manno-heptose 1,7-bisphosphate phosphatase